MAVLIRGDGKQYDFSRTGGAGSPWVTDADVTGTLVSLGSSSTPTGWTFTNAQDELESYDADGKLLSITNREGAAQTLAYSCTTVSSTCPSVTSGSVAPIAGLLISVTDSAGRQINFTYDRQARISTIADPSGGVYSYIYGSGSNTANLVSVTYPGGAVRSYLYSESGNVSSSPATGVDYTHALTGIQDENGSRYVTWRYDANGRAYSSEHGSNGADRVSMTYNTDGSVAVVDALGTTRTYNFATSSGTVRNVGITGQPCDGCFTALAYDSNGNVTSETDFNGHVTCLSYDLTRNLETARVEGLPAGTACPSSLDGYTVPAGARKITTQWHATWRKPVRIAEPGRITSYSYNGDSGQLCAPTTAVVGNGVPIGVPCSQTAQPTADADGSQGFGAGASGTARTQQWTYDSNGQALTAKGLRTDVSDQVSLSYRAADDTAMPPQYRRGDLYQVIDALGHTTTVDKYDPNGRPLQLTDANSVVTTFTYTPRGWLTRQTVTPAGGVGQTTSYSYDAAGQLTQVTQPDGGTVSFSYDPAHRLTGASDSQGNSVTYTLDAMGNRTQEQTKDPSGSLARQVTRVIDSLNRVQKVTVGASGN
ncbi:type IV secretion protein Rhs (plasmid) [Ralstonia solanacearum]|nr:type IV secretion protein Rhs [Ralstonia solanacearum]